MTDKAKSDPMGEANMLAADSFYGDQEELAEELNAGSNQIWNAFSDLWNWIRAKFRKKGKP